MKQKTLANTVEFHGIGLHTGLPVSMSIYPADQNCGIKFVRTDIAIPSVITAHYSNVTSSKLCTVLTEDYASISTVEHIMAALFLTGVTNCAIEVTGPEVPIMDGSAKDFVEGITRVGVVDQQSDMKIVKVLKPLTIADTYSTISIIPDDSFSVDMRICFEDCLINIQQEVFCINNIDCASARTFGFEKDIDLLKANNLALGGSLNNAIIVSKNGKTVLNSNGLRFDNEFVKHKILDLLGDLYLSNVFFIGKVIGNCSGHTQNIKMLTEFFKNKDNYEIVHAEETS